VGFHNWATRLDLGFYAARSYSLMSPATAGRRLIRFWQRSATGDPATAGGADGSDEGAGRAFLEAGEQDGPASQPDEDQIEQTEGYG
jgi:hypothetical protein